MLKKLFGLHLGTCDYGHLVIDHSAMLLRNFRSFYKYSGQGFEASHKLHRQLYSKAINHDSFGPGQSCELQDNNYGIAIISRYLHHDHYLIINCYHNCYNNIMGLLSSITIVSVSFISEYFLDRIRVSV